MRIEQAQIRNFRPLRDVTIRFDDVTTFIGPNGTGKSAVLRALDWFFNGSKSGDLCEKDCSYGAVDQDIEVQVTFGQLTDADRAELGKYAPDGVTTFTAWKKRTCEGEEYLSANAKGLPAFAEIKGAANATDKKNAYNALRTANPGLGLPSATTGPLVDAAITEWESNNTDKLEDVSESLQTNFFGFYSAGKMSGLFDFVLVTADLRASEESQDAKSSIIGRILERTVDRSAADEEIGAIVEQSRLAQQKVYGDKFKQQLDQMAASLNAVVESYAPGRAIKVFPSDVELKAPRTTFNVSVVDGDTETVVERQGHGFQRTLLISALQLLAQSGSGESEGVICLAIEEPELFQHPIQAQAFAKVLRKLAEDPSQRIQVAYATHSPYFVDGSKFSQIRRMTRSSGEITDIEVGASTLGDVKKLLEGTVKPEKVDRQLAGTVSARLPVALFANRVVLVEGATEASVVCGIADRTSPGHLEKLGVSVVDVGGKSSIPLAHAILTSLGIPTYSMFDGDGGFEARAHANGKDDAEVESERKSHVAANRCVMSYFKLSPVDFPPETETASVTILEDRLEALLKQDWPNWSEACSKLEDELGITLAKNSAAYRTATLEAEGDPCPLLVRVIDKAIGASVSE